MLTKRAGTTTLISLWLMLWLTSGANGATVTWGQVNKYASTLHAQDVYLPHPEMDVDVVYGSQNDQAIDGYTITAVHAYDMTPLALHGGDGGTAQLLSGGVGQQHARVRFKRHSTDDQLPEAMHFQLVIYGINL
ncbi:uncharacterized protein LOC132790804 [Drosophila nasuta]|uniref:uncharacterized protein LOC132790804 n=1 Tax=Drosophila nasuta TaxID=42062 RepID=UPI00295E5CC1|nr:uncharacterized protein LOC132790804 [Drosophila nasuta]